MRHHEPGDGLDDGNGDSVAELAIGLRVRDRDVERLPSHTLEPHEPCTLARCQPARVLSLLPDEDLRPVLVVTRRKRPGGVIGSDQPEPKAVAPCPVLL